MASEHARPEKPALTEVDLDGLARAAKLRPSGGRAVCQILAETLKDTGCGLEPQPLTFFTRVLEDPGNTQVCTSSDQWGFPALSGPRGWWFPAQSPNVQAHLADEVRRALGRHAPPPHARILYGLEVPASEDALIFRELFSWRPAFDRGWQRAMEGRDRFLGRAGTTRWADPAATVSGIPLDDLTAWLDGKRETPQGLAGAVHPVSPKTAGVWIAPHPKQPWALVVPAAGHEQSQLFQAAMAGRLPAASPSAGQRQRF